MTPAARVLRWAAFLATAAAAADVVASLVAPLPTVPPKSSRHAPSRRPSLATAPEPGRDPFKAAAYALTPTSPLGLGCSDSPSIRERFELIGTVVGSSPADSMAIVHESSAPAESSRTLHVGERLDGTASVEAIDRHDVRLATPSGIQVLCFHWQDDPNDEPDNASAVSPTVATDTTSADRIRRDANGEFTIPAETFDRYVADPAPLFSQARLVPAVSGNATTGFRIFSIQRGSLFEQLGLRNGDVIRKFRGKDLASLDLALGALDDLRAHRDFDLTLLRDEREQTLAYRVR